MTLDVGAHVFTGFGGGYSGVDCISYGEPAACEDPEHPGRFAMPQREEVTLYVGEVLAAAQVSVVPDVLSLGVSLRLPWARTPGAKRGSASGRLLDSDCIFLR